MKASNIGKSDRGLNKVLAIGCMVAAAGALFGCGGGGGSETDAAVSENRDASISAVNRAEATLSWTQIAQQGQTFQSENSVVYRYGEGDLWVKRKLSGTVRCDTAAFGTDPSPGRQKVCQAKDQAWAPGVGRLSWSASSDSKVVGYRVYYGTSPKNYLQAAGRGFDAGQQTSFSVAGLRSGSTYYFAVTAVDASGNESSYSNEAAKAIAQ